MMWSREPAAEVQSAPFLRGFMWDLGFSGMHTSCVFRLKALLMPSARTLLMASFSTKTSGKDGNSGCALHH